MDSSFFFSRFLDSMFAGLKEAKHLTGEVSSPRTQIHGDGASLQKSRQLGKMKR
jgi:hypothetical protein